MFSSTILDVAVGLIFVFMAVSLAASAILEAIGGIITWRSGTLLKSIKRLLNDEEFTGLAVELYRHALINPRNTGRIDAKRGADAEKALRQDAPAYIDPKQFANALIDILDAAHPGKMISGNADSINGAIDRAAPVHANPQINDLLRGIARRAGGDLDRMKQEIGAWFDNAMDRVSGVYKRWTQLWNFLIALILAGMLNISAIHVATVLWKQPAAAKAIENNKAINDKDALAAIGQVESLALPIGWFQYRQPSESSSGAPTGPYWEDAPEMLLGWLITAVAALFGAPFWFDLLQRIIRLKAAGPSPKEKQTDAAAAS
jgi:hypothetical protein